MRLEWDFFYSPVVEVVAVEEVMQQGSVSPDISASAVLYRFVQQMLGWS